MSLDFFHHGYAMRTRLVWTSLISILFAAQSLLAGDQSICSLCGLHFKYRCEVVEHQREHAIKEPVDASAFYQLHDAIMHHALKMLQSGKSINSGLKINLKDQSLTISASHLSGHRDKIVINDAGASLLLWATHNKDMQAIKVLLERPEHLANLLVVDDAGRNALAIAEDHLTHLTPGNAKFDDWQKTVKTMQDVFRFFAITRPEEHVMSIEFISKRSEAQRNESLYHYAEINGLIP
jgi:hypothetical protein